MKKLLVLLLLLYPLSAMALTYEWTDDRGTVNFTEDLGKVPKKYRKKAKVLGAEESGTPKIIESAEPAQGKPKDAGTQAGGKKDKKESPTKDEAALRNEYLSAKANLQALEQSVASLKERLNDTSKMARSEYLSLQNTLKQEEFRLQDQKKKLDQVRASAAKQGVSLDQK